MSCNRSFSVKSVHKETTIENRDSQVGTTFDTSQQLGCLHRSDRCLSTRSDSSSIQEIPSFRKKMLREKSKECAALPRHQEEEETDKTKQTQIKQMYEKPLSMRGNRNAQRTVKDKNKITPGKT